MQLQTHQHDKRIINDYFAYNGLLLYIVFFFSVIPYNCI